jgi:hypothetical protein
MTLGKNGVRTDLVLGLILGRMGTLALGLMGTLGGIVSHSSAFAYETFPNAPRTIGVLLSTQDPGYIEILAYPSRITPIEVIGRTPEGQPDQGRTLRRWVPQFQFRACHWNAPLNQACQALSRPRGVPAPRPEALGIPPEVQRALSEAQLEALCRDPHFVQARDTRGGGESLYAHTQAFYTCEPLRSSAGQTVFSGPWLQRQAEVGHRQALVLGARQAGARIASLGALVAASALAWEAGPFVRGAATSWVGAAESTLSTSASSYLQSALPWLGAGIDLSGAHAVSSLNRWFDGTEERAFSGSLNPRGATVGSDVVQALRDPLSFRARVFTDAEWQQLLRIEASERASTLLLPIHNSIFEIESGILTLFRATDTSASRIAGALESEWEHPSGVGTTYREVRDTLNSATTPIASWWRENIRPAIDHVLEQRRREQERNQPGWCSRPLQGGCRLLYECYSDGDPIDPARFRADVRAHQQDQCPRGGSIYSSRIETFK